MSLTTFAGSRWVMFTVSLVLFSIALRYLVLRWLFSIEHGGSCFMSLLQSVSAYVSIFVRFIGALSLLAHEMWRTWWRTTKKGRWRQDFIEVAKRAVLEIKKKTTCSHSSSRKWPHVAGCSTGRIWNFQSSVPCIICSHLQPLEWPRVAASGHKWAQVAARCRKWPQVAAAGASGRWGKWPQVAASGCLDDKYQPEWPQPWKREFFFSRTAFFQDFFTTWGEGWNERQEITNRKEQFKRKDGRNEMDELKGKEELNDQDKRVDTKAQTQQIERKSWNGRKNWTIRT